MRATCPLRAVPRGPPGGVTPGRQCASGSSAGPVARFFVASKLRRRARVENTVLSGRVNPEKPCCFPSSPSQADCGHIAWKLESRGDAEHGKYLEPRMVP